MSAEAEKIVQGMMERDAFSRWLGIRVISVTPGSCDLHMQVTADMCNGFGIAHGGIAFSIADSACSFAVNAHGRKSMSVESSVNQFRSIALGDAIHCRARELSLGKKLAIYTCEITNQHEELVALYKGTYYRSDKWWAEDEPVREASQPGS